MMGAARDISLVFFITVLCFTCSKQTQTSEGSRKASQEQLSESVNEFGYKMLLQMMKTKENTDILLSPTGVAGLLAMTLLGSVGKAYDQLAAALGFSPDILLNRKNHEDFGNLLQALNSNGSSQTLYADAVFVDEEAHLRTVYQEYLSHVYRGEALIANFTDYDSAKLAINNWVLNNTGGKIEDFLKQPLPVETKIVLLSALYFNGQWALPFQAEYTRQMSFKTPKGDVMVDQMINMNEFDYIYSTKYDAHMIALPYNDSETTMYALMPRVPKRLSLPDLMGRLDYHTIDALTKQMTKRQLVARFPKMDLYFHANLEETLKALGVTSLFEPDEANFALMLDSNTFVNKAEDELISRINTGSEEPRSVKEIVGSLVNPGLHVDAILHDVKISINEYGTEAVAASGGILGRTAVMFYADTPFYFFIRNEKTKLVTFSALIFDPTA